MSNRHEDDAKRVLQELDQEIRSRGHGAIREVERALGRSVGWWQRRVESGDLNLSQLLAVLGKLGLNPSRYLKMALDDGQELDLDLPRGKPPRIVGKAWNRIAAGNAGDLGRGYLDEIDRLRYDAPRLALERAEAIIDHVPLEDLPLLLGIAGSAYRLWDIRLDEAEHAIRAGIKIALERRDQRSYAELLQRLSYVISDRADFAGALQLTERAMIIHVVNGEMSGVGKSLVDQGLCLSKLGRMREAIHAQEAALKYLPSEQNAYRFAAVQSLALYYLRSGDVEKACELAKQAEGLVAGLAASARAKLCWLKAEICTNLKEYDQAERYLKAAIDIFSSIHYGETALATTDLIRIQLLRGYPRAAYTTAQTMYQLVEPLRGNPIVAAAVSDLLRVGQASLELALVEGVKSRLEKARVRREWRTLCV